MQRVVRICCRLTSYTTRNSFFSHHVDRNKPILSSHTQSLVPMRFKHATGADRHHRGASSRPTSDSVTEEQQFSGYIPVEELEFSYSRSSGPGGQHVNKVNTKVEARFHVASASWLSEDVKSRLLQLEKNRITKEGYLVLSSERTRKQLLNQADVMDKLRTMVFRAAAKPRGLTEEEIDIRDKRLHKSKDRTLREKRDRSMKKQSRGSQNV